MIISHKHKYLFIGIPLSGSSAISKELIENYDGEAIFNKHTNIPYLLKNSKINIEEYFVFAVFRNPIEFSFSRYNKLKYNAKGVYNNPKYYKENGGTVNKRNRVLFDKVNNENLGFEQYTRHVYKFFPFDNMFSSNVPYLNFVINFNNLSDDFNKVLLSCNIIPKRKLPVYNKSIEKDKKIEISRNLKKRIFYPFMKQHLIISKSKYGETIKPYFFSSIIYYILKPIRNILWLEKDKHRTDRNDDYFSKLK